MRVLTLYAHPQSFNHGILERLTKGLTEAGHTARCMDVFIKTCDGIFDVCGINNIEYQCFDGVQVVGEQG